MHTCASRLFSDVLVHIELHLFTAVCMLLACGSHLFTNVLLHMKNFICLRFVLFTVIKILRAMNSFSDMMRA